MESTRSVVASLAAVALLAAALSHAAPSSARAAPSSDRAAPSSGHAAPSSDRAAPQSGTEAPRAPYPPSREITGIHWNFRGAKPLRRANGSDLWPCTWARDDALYCAWGDGGGFDGNSDSTGRVSLGFARVTGTPRIGDPASFHGKNIWGAPPYAQVRATFGGKVGSLIAVDGVLYANGSLWTRQNSKDPVATWEAGTLDRLIWSDDSGRTWRIADWAPIEDLGSYLHFGRDGVGPTDDGEIRDSADAAERTGPASVHDQPGVPGRTSANAPGGYVYVYYSRPHDPAYVYLKRVPASALGAAPEQSHAWQYLAFLNRSGDAVSWSPRPVDAVPVFADPQNAIGPNVVYDAGLGRYLLTVGHDPSGELADAAPGKLGVFVAAHPWGPWHTIYYGDDWGHFPASTHGDFLGLTFPAKWISRDGRTLWGVFSGPGGLDAFNLVQVRLVTREHAGRDHRAHRPHRAGFGSHAPGLTRCAQRYNAVNRSVFMLCRAARAR